MCLSLAMAFSSPTRSADEVLKFETKISLGVVSGRIDHIAIDLKRQRAFIAELGNNSIGVVDLANLKLLKRITGLKEPQGVAWVGASDRLFVSNAGDGTVRMFGGDDLAPSGEVALGDDADNIRVDSENRVFVGYGNGGIAILDGSTGGKIGDLRLVAHPEAFEIEPGGKRLFVNEPAANRVSVVSAVSGKELDKWVAAKERGNFAMALDSARKQLFVVYRNQPAITVFDTGSGLVLTQLSTCGDADDVFFDARRKRLYLSCGEGFIAVLDAAAAGKLLELGRIATRPGARTALFEPTLDRLFLAVRAQQGAPAELWVYRP